MSRDIVIVDKEALEAIRDATIAYAQEASNCLQDSVLEIENVEAEWNDEDYLALIATVTAAKTNLNNIVEQSKKLISKLNDKIGMIDALHGGV